jgi:hypothetical protein
LRLAVRGLARSPLIVLAAVGTQAVGIASTTFSAVNAVLLQPLRFGHPEQLALVWMARRQKAGYGNPTVRIGAAEATANFFSAAEVQAALGRAFTEEEVRTEHACWC